MVRGSFRKELSVSDFRLGVKAAVPTALGYVAIGLAFGVVAAASGLSALEVGLMCALVYGGSAQFAMCALVVAGAGLGELTLTVFLVNLRNMLMSLHATTIFTKTSLWNQLGIGSLITDESYGVLLGEYVHHKDIPANWMHGNNIFSYLVWIVSSVIGCLIGSMIPNPELFGLDFALIAMFIGLLSSQIDALLGEGVRKLLLILLSIAVAYLSFSVILSESLAVLVATLVGCSVGVMCDGRQWIYSHCYSTWVCGQLGSSCASLCFSEIQGASRYRCSIFALFTSFYPLCSDSL